MSRAIVELSDNHNHQSCLNIVTPLQPKDFFRGVWQGEGQLLPHPLVRWLLPPERIRFSSEAVWLSETVWLVKDRSEFSSGRILERKMFAELIAPTNIHLSADDMPFGADVYLHERGFDFSPYYILAPHHGRVFKLRCYDRCSLDEAGRIHDVIRMYWYGFPVARMYLGPLERKD